MAAPTIKQIVTAIEDKFQTIEGLRHLNHAPGGQIAPPVAFVSLSPINYRQVFGARKFSLAPRVIVLVSAATDRLREQLLAEYADIEGAKSIFAAFGGAGGTDLGGLVDHCFATDFQPLGREDVGQLGYYGGAWDLSVMASRGA